MKRLGLAAKFAVVSAVSMAALGFLLTRVEATQIRNRALASATDATRTFADASLRSRLQPSNLVDGIGRHDLAELDAVFRAGLADGRVARVKVWSPSGTVVYSDDRGLIGRRFSVSSELRQALDGHVSSEVSSLTSAENADERQFGQLLEVYLPLRFRPAGAPAGAFEIYVPYAPIARAIATDTKRLYLITVCGLVLLWVVLWRMVFAASRRLRRDADELARRAEENEHLAMHDQLTGLPNRLLFRDRLEQTIRAAIRDGGLVGVLVLDLTRFKEINDALGHEYGDALLREIGPRLGTVLRGVDTVARLGGDEFGVVAGGLRSSGDATEIADKIRRALETPFPLADLELRVGASIGVALYPEHGVGPDVLMRGADVAMYVSKADRSPVTLYSPDRDGYTKERLAFVTSLRRAIEDGDILLVYQPKLDLETSRVVGVEALATWRHPEHGNVPPDVFIPLAEQAGLIRALTSHVIAAALRQCRWWLDTGIELPVAVNVSMRDLVDPTLPDEITKSLERYDLSPSMLEIEITESSIMDRPGLAFDVMERLARSGLTLAIDDFGTGYSSLAYLQRLPVRELKIDRSFVMKLASNDNDAEIVRSTLSLAHTLGLSVVAEGVEDQGSLERLSSMGCDVAQGYYIGRPMPADAVPNWMQTSGLLATPSPADAR